MIKTTDMKTSEKLIYLNSVINKIHCIVPITILILCTIIPSNANAQGGLLITPRRVIFDGSTKILNLNLANTGLDTASYSISFTEYKMNIDGGFEEIAKTDSVQYYASDYLRVYPRTVVLAPKEAQLVKVQLKNYSRIPQGECRSHIYFRSKSELPPLGEELKTKDSTSITVRLTPIYGISVPVFIRKGKQKYNISISDLSISIVNDTTPRINFTINREGNTSVYGDIIVNHVSSDNNITQVSIARGLAVYSPNLIRHVHLDIDSTIDYSDGVIDVIYKIRRKNNYEGLPKLAESRLIL